MAGEGVQRHSFWPSSKTCSRCGVDKLDLSLWERLFRRAVRSVVVDRHEEPCIPCGRRRREWTGDGKRPWTGSKTGPAPVVLEVAGSRQRAWA